MDESGFRMFWAARRSPEYARRSAELQADLLAAVRCRDNGRGRNAGVGIASPSAYPSRRAGCGALPRLGGGVVDVATPPRLPTRVGSSPARATPATLQSASRAVSEAQSTPPLRCPGREPVGPFGLVPLRAGQRHRHLRPSPSEGGARCSGCVVAAAMMDPPGPPRRGGLHEGRRFRRHTSYPKCSAWRGSMTVCLLEIRSA